MNYIKQTILFFVLAGLSLSAFAQDIAFEQSWVQLEDGQPLLAELQYNVKTDVLTVRENDGEAQVYRPCTVVSFAYAGDTYYSLPLNGGYSYFKVLHEGDNFAVLLKPANLPLLEFFVRQSRGTLTICEDPEDASKKVLCEGSIGPSFGMPTYTGSAVEYEVEDALFVAIGGQVHLVSCKYDTKGNLFTTVPKLQKSNKYVLRRLNEVVQNQQKMLALRKHVASASPDLEDPQQLIQALKTIYN